MVAILLPILLNLLFNLRVGPFRQVDLTPFAFVLTTAVLVWGVYQFSLLDLLAGGPQPDLRTISDPVLVLDPQAGAGRQPGRRTAGRPAAGRGRRPAGGQLLPTWSATLTAALTAGVDQATEEVTRDGRIYDCLAISALPDRQRQPGGHLVVARDVTERRARSRSGCAPPSTTNLVATDRLAVALDREPGRGRAPAHPGRAQERLPPGRPTTCAPRWPRCWASP